MLDESDWSRLARHLAGEDTPEEAAALRDRLARDADWRREADAMRLAWTEAERPAETWDTDAAWARLRARAAVRAQPAPVREHAPIRRDRVWRARVWGVAGIAAAALIAAGIGRVALRRAALVGATPDDTGRVYATAPGQRAVIDLVDGTRVELGVASTLRVRRFPDRRGERGRREVVLDGEAVFDVVHDSTRPFLVHSGNAIAEDLGTRFSVRAYAGDRAVRVAVASGSVALRAAGAPNGSGTLLGAGDMATLDSAGRASVTSRADTAIIFAWTRGRLVFRDVPLATVAEQLSRWFGVPIAVPDSAVAARPVTLNVPARSLQDVIDVLTTALRIEQARDGRGWILGPRASR